MMKRLFLIFFFLFCMAGIPQAALTTIGTATYGGSDYKLIWDDDDNGNSVVWLDLTTFAHPWGFLTSWAAGLDTAIIAYNINPGYNINWGGSSWRLPSTVDGIAVDGNDGTTTGGYNITSSEMGHLYYDELNNLGWNDTSGNFQSGYGLLNTGPFENLIDVWYWTGTEYAANPYWAWRFYTNIGYQWYGDKLYSGFGMAIRNGQVSAVPVPTTILLLASGLVGLVGIRRRKE